MGALAPGSVFAGRYRIIARIGAGGMGAVYEAEQLSTRKRRAVKVLSNRFDTDDKAQARFVREATVGADIDSGHVVDVIGAGIDEETGLPWLAMELLDGVDLKRIVQRDGRIDPRHVYDLFTQLGHGLASAHGAGVVHRDLKPENIFVARSRRAGGTFTVKILDFGIAKVTREAVVSTDTATIGSPMWMAPEQINAEPLSLCTDVWALGLLAFWAVSGRYYWKAAYGERVTVQALFAEQLFSPLELASVRAQEYGVAPRIPDGFDDWFTMCVARDPSHRFTDARAAMGALETVLAPWAAMQTGTLPALLPEPGAPDAATRVNSGPALSPGADHEAMAQMAGTTADVLSLQGVSPTLHGISASGPNAIDVTSPQEGQSAHATGEPEASQPSIPPQPRQGPARSGVGRIVAAVAIPAALAGAAAGGWWFWDPPEPEPEPVQQHVPDPPPTVEDEDDDVETDDDDGTQAPPPKGKDPVSSGHVDLSTLPMPASIRFLGWTADGDRVVVRAGYGSKVARRSIANYVELIHVLTAEDGKLEASYVVDRVASANLDHDDPLAEAARVALGADAWLQRRVELLLRPPEARRVPSQGNGEITLEITDVPHGTKTAVHPKRAGFDVSWWGFDALEPESTPPTMTVGWSQGSSRAELLSVALDPDVAFLRELTLRSGDAAMLDGYVRFYWSSDGARCVVVLDLKAGRGDEGLVDRRWFVVSMPSEVDYSRPRIKPR